MLLRDFRPEDFPDLCRIDQACFEPGIAYPPQDLAWWLARGAFAIVAEDNGQITGFILARKTRVAAAQIITIDILEPHRKRGVGTELMTAAEERLAALGAPRVRLEVSVENKAALSFYDRLGYRRTKRLPRYYLDRIDAWQMEKELKRARNG